MDNDFAGVKKGASVGQPSGEFCPASHQPPGQQTWGEAHPVSAQWFDRCTNFSVKSS